jgi:hypothetical protein
VIQALVDLEQLLAQQPEFADVLRSTLSTDEARLALLDHGIVISNEALWRHRGMLMKDGQPTWRG